MIFSTFDIPAVAASSPNAGMLETSGSTSLHREDFPQLVKALLATAWPPVVREKHCQAVAVGEAYAGAICSGTFLAPSFPLRPSANACEDYPGPSGFNSLTGEHLTILIHMRLAPAGSEAAAGAGNSHPLQKACVDQIPPRRTVGQTTRQGGLCGAGLPSC